MKFIFDQRVYKLGVRGVYFNIRGMRNLPSNDPAVVAVVEQRVEGIPRDLDESPILRGFHNLHTSVSAKADKLVSAPANLLHFYRTHDDIPRINGIVDVYNAVSLASGIAIGAHDLAFVDGNIELRLTRGDETFLPLGGSKPVRVPSGEYAYIDERNDILCRLEVRQVEKTKVTLLSRDVFFIVQGHAEMDGDILSAASKELITACHELFGGDLEPLYPYS
jgi:DNA/RNA-binding domain of Phe-tRNA-synthetase-like protein